jgi:dihydropyrimidinase
MLDLLLTNARLYLPQQGLTEGVLGVIDGRIAIIAEPGAQFEARETIDCQGLWVLPGLIDPHVHFGFGSPETDFDRRRPAVFGVARYRRDPGRDHGRAL